MTSGGWGCPFDDNGNCAKRELPCEPCAQGCVLHSRFKLGQKKADASSEDDSAPTEDEQK